MNESSIKLHDLILKTKNSDISRHELNFLIAKSYQISISFLRSKFKSKLIFLNSNINGLEDIAIDAIIPLFLKDNFGKLGISRSLENWNDSIDSSIDSEYFLSRIIWRRVDQTVTHVFKEKDPIFGKILKTLNVCIKNNNYKKERYFGTVLILENNDVNLLGEIIDEHNFNLIPEVCFGLKQRELFKKLFEYFVSETKYHPAIPLNLLVKRIKRYHSNGLTTHQDQTNTYDEVVSLNEIVSSGLENIKKKLDTYYVPRNKLNESEADLIYAAFDNISSDMLNGGIHESLYFYLKDQERTLTREIFYIKYHHIMNYLLSRFKNNVAQKLYF